MNNISTSAASENSGEKKGGTRTFNEKQVSKIVGERLARERKNNAVLSDVRDMVMNLVRQGVIKSKNIAEMGDELAELISKMTTKDKEAHTAAENSAAEKSAADENIVTDASAQKAAQAPMAVEAPEKNEAESESKPVTHVEALPAHDTASEIDEFIKLFPDVNLSELLNDEDFRVYAESHDKNGSISTVYISYLRDISRRLEDERNRKRQDFTRGLASTGFSAKSGGGTDYSELLTPAQMRIAKDAGMSYREYADYLSQLSRKN